MHKQLDTNDIDKKMNNMQKGKLEIIGEMDIDFSPDNFEKILVHNDFIRINAQYWKIN